MFATGLALIGQEFRGAERGKAIAAWGATVGAGVAVGPLFGGAITDSLGWRWIFFINVPIGLITGWLAVTRMVNVSDASTTRLDVAGLVTFSAAMFLLVFGLIETNTHGWTSAPIVTYFVASAVLFAAFIVVEIRQARPMFDLGLFRLPSFTGVSVATFAIGGGMFAVYPFITLYLQNDLGFSPLRGGLCILPSTILLFVVPLALRTTFERISARVALAGGMAIAAVGLAAMLIVTASSHWYALVPGLLLTGFGVGIVNPAIARTGLGVVAPERSGMASGLSNTFRIAGLATGIAALGAVFQRHISSTLGEQLGHPAPALAKVLTSAGVRAAVATNPGQPGLAAASHSAFVAGFHLIVLIGAAVVAFGAVIAFALVRRQDFHAYRAEVAASGFVELISVSRCSPLVIATFLFEDDQRRS